MKIMLKIPSSQLQTNASNKIRLKVSVKKTVDYAVRLAIQDQKNLLVLVSYNPDKLFFDAQLMCYSHFYHTLLRAQQVESSYMLCSAINLINNVDWRPNPQYSNA